MRLRFQALAGFLLVAASFICASTTIHVQVPNLWNNGTDDLVFSVSASMPGGEPVSLTLSYGSDGWFTGSYENPISVISSRTFTIETSNGTHVSEESQLSTLSSYSEGEVWIRVLEDGSISIIGETSPGSLSSSSAGLIGSSSSVFNFGKKKVRFLNPWTNTTPSIVVGNDTTKMTAVPDTCGWYAAEISSDVDDVIFVQTVGAAVYTASGLSAGLQIALDSIWTISDIVWINSKTVSGLPELFSSYPKALGDCPSRSLAVTLYDWLDGSGSSESDREKYDTGVNTDFGKIDNEGSCSGVVRGMVKYDLGANGLPVRNDENFPLNCKKSAYINKWFLPETLAVQNNAQYTNATCRDITMILEDSTGMWLSQMNKTGSTTSGSAGGAFLLDDFKYLDSDGTISNPHYDYLSGSGGYHNFGFTMKVHAQFVYVEGQYFDFYGDDDVWVFIDNRLAVDIGGVHDQQPGAVNLDTIGETTGNRLIPGNTYSFDMFYAERKQTESNFRMRTSMDLKTERSYFTTTAGTGVKEYTIWQRVSTQGLSCDYSTTDTTMLAPSSFILSGGSLPSDGVDLDTAGIWYGGIKINANMSSFSIDTATILALHTLSPGKYTLTFSLQDDPSLTDEVTFIVPEYDAPSLIFTDSKWNRILADTTVLGEWANVAYPVYVALTYDSLSSELYLTSSDPALIFIDQNGNQVTSVMLQSGHAQFYVMGTSAVVGGSFSVSGASFNNVLVWPNINLAAPPVPTMQAAGMFDRTGDGIPDSVYFTFSRAISGDDALDSLHWIFGDSTVHKEYSFAKIDTATVVVTSATGFISSVFTGLQNTTYSGAASAYFTYAKSPFKIDGQIADKIGPVILSATVSSKDDISILSLVVSEALNDSQVVALANAFEYRFWRTGILNGSVMVPSYVVRNKPYQYDLYFHLLASAVPEVGDSIRFVPGTAFDLNYNVPHVNNPWVRIVGEEQVQVTSTTLITVTTETAPAETSSAVTVTFVSKDESVEQASLQTGTHGQLVDFDLAELLANENTARGDSLPLLTADDAVIYYETYYFTNLGQYVNSSKGAIACSDAVFGGDCSVNKGNLFLAWNMRSDSGRLVGTGAYISHLDVKVKLAGKVVARKSVENVWGVRRGSGVYE
ncbi:MAG: fibro-slime domain-containing protein [Fibrobacteraceae bacterium]